MTVTICTIVTKNVIVKSEKNIGEMLDDKFNKIYFKKKKYATKNVDYC